MSVSIVLPTMNEEAGLRIFGPAIEEKGWAEQILVLDGGSKDGTVAFARSRGYDVVVQSRPGMRVAYIQVHPHIRGDIVITFSPDGNSVVDAIPRLLAKMNEGYDMVIASRYRDGAKSEDDTVLTRLANRFFTKAIGRFGYPYTDAMVMYRAWRRTLPVELGLTRERSAWWEQNLGRYVSWEPQMSIRCAKRRLRIAEIGADEPRRLDEDDRGLLLPTTRIQHYRAGVACLVQLIEEALIWDWKR